MKLLKLLYHHTIPKIDVYIVLMRNKNINYKNISFLEIEYFLNLIM